MRNYRKFQAVASAIGTSGFNARVVSFLSLFAPTYCYSAPTCSFSFVQLVELLPFRDSYSSPSVRVGVLVRNDVAKVTSMKAHAATTATMESLCPINACNGARFSFSHGCREASLNYDRLVKEKNLTR
ncbi:hypothetical protein V6N13_071456 [Hibiscus sabdariffa]